MLLQQQGALDLAEPIFRAAGAAQREALGAEHPQTLTTLNSLASLLYDKGDLDGAEPLMRRALEARERTLGTEHPDTKNSAIGLWNVLAKRGDRDVEMARLDATYGI